jgi:hypothetical protein
MIHVVVDADWRRDRARGRTRIHRNRACGVVAPFELSRRTR